MDTAVKKYFHEDIKNRVRLTGGYSFETWLLTLTSGKRIVFRTAADFETGGGRKIIIADIFEREKFFYDSLNKEIGYICPEVYVIDNTREYYDFPYQISEFIEGMPLNLCFDSFSKRKKDGIYYRIGEIAAGINKMEIDLQHPYVSCRSSWEEFIAFRLRERLIPLIKNNIITVSEIDKITDGLRSQTAKKNLSFLHLDLRFDNMIYHNGSLYILDAENCEFGDPLHELSVIDITNNLTASFLEGYKNISGEDIDLDCDLYHYYKMERLALALNLYINVVGSDNKETRDFLSGFYALKSKLLH